MSLALKFWSILKPRQQRTAIGLVLLMLTSTLFEMLGIGLILPGLTLLARAKAGAHPHIVLVVRDWLGNPSRSEMVALGAIALLAIYFAKAVVVLYTAYRQARFVRQLDRSLCERLFSTYLTQPWAYHLRSNSADRIRNLTSMAGLADACSATLNAIAELFILCGIVATLIWIDPFATLIVGALVASSTWLLNRLFHRRSKRWGHLRHQYHGEMMKTVQQGLGGVKDAKILGRESYFIEQYSRQAGVVARVCEQQSFVFVVPRLWHELAGVSALCALTVVMVLQKKPIETFIPTLGVFAAAGFRMLPAVNRLSTALQLMSYWSPMVQTAVDELSLQVPSETAQPRSPGFSFQDALVIKDVSFCYEGTAAKAIDQINIRIPCGSSVGIVGSSGAGKSTLVDVLLGLLSPTSGQVLVDGVDIADHLRAWRRCVGYVPQSIFLCDDSIRANVAFGVDAADIDERAVVRALKAAQLDNFVASLSSGLDTLVGERGVRLSGGQRQRIGIARALYHDPRVLVLDEATSALDTDTERDVMKAVEALHGVKTLIIVAHRMSTVANCDVLYRLEKGRIARSGSFQEIVGHGV